MTPDPSLTAVMAEVDEVKGIMVKNIDKALSRGERLDNIMDQAEELQSEVRQLAQDDSKGACLQGRAFPAPATLHLPRMCQWPISCRFCSTLTLAPPPPYHTQASRFHSSAKKLRKKMWWQKLCGCSCCCGCCGCPCK